MAGSKSQKQRQAKKARDKKERELKAENGGKTEIQPETHKQAFPESLQENGVHAEPCCRNQHLADKSEGNGSSSQIAGTATEVATVLAGRILTEKRSPQEMKISHGVMEETEAVVHASLKDGWTIEVAQENKSLPANFREPAGDPQKSLALTKNLRGFETEDSQGSAVNSLENGMEVVTGSSPQDDTTHFLAVPIPHGTTRKSKAGSGVAPDQIEGALTKQELLSANTAEIKAIHGKLLDLKDADVATKREILSLSQKIVNTSAENFETEKQIAAAAVEVVKLRNEKAALVSNVAENEQSVNRDKAALTTLEDETKQVEKEAEEYQMKLTALVTEKSHLAEKLKASLSLQIELQKSLETETNAMAELDTSVESLKTQVAEEERLLADVLAKLRETISNKERMELELLEQTLSAMKSKLEAAKIAGRETVAKLDSLKQETLHVEAEIISAAGEQERKKAEAGHQWTPAGSLMTIAGASVLALAFAFVSRFRL